jgi:SAM-dependent methyltransferase
MEIKVYKDKIYPHFQTEGFAAQYIFPFAQKVCKGVGCDIGPNKLEWAFPGSIPVDIVFNDKFHALNLPKTKKLYDYIFSSHCLEHIKENWTDVLDYWMSKIKGGGILFLYLPDYSQEYWRPWNNKKHIHIFTPQIMQDYFNDRNDVKHFFVSGIDLYNSFSVVVEKAGF